MEKLEKSVPVIRFKGFSEAWEQRKLGKEVENVATGRSTFFTSIEQSSETPYAVLGSTSVISYDKNFDHSGDFILTARVGANAGNLYKYSGDVKISDNTVYIQAKSLDFVYYLLNKFDLKRLSFGTGQPLVKASELKNLKLMFPNDEEEQQKIGKFFKYLDDTIALHQRKLDALKLMKKGFLQQMFPKIEADIPEIRFADFDGKWEQRKLGEIFNERSERSADGELISVTINSGVVKASKLEKKDNSSFDKSNYKVVKKGDIAYNSMRMWQGASGYSSYDGILSPAYTVIYPRKDIDTIFIAYMFKKIDMIQTFQRNSQGLTSDTWNLKFPSLSTIKIKIPANDEQIKITNLFQKLEYTSILHQNQIEMLKKVKKAYLQTMFI
ncbi:TPA: restriction endonuclease subunit S [Listeria monocytogenes]|nr:restriction endonuclease subunit S [Listeria monocytogenes]EAD1770028.1 restriction endonuclease subunit S [Listeria monocytogenes]